MNLCLKSKLDIICHEQKWPSVRQWFWTSWIKYTIVATDIHLSMIKTDTHHDLGGTNGTPAMWIHNKITIPVDYVSQGFSMVFTVDAADGTSIGLDDIVVQECVDQNESLKGRILKQFIFAAPRMYWK